MLFMQIFLHFATGKNLLHSIAVKNDATLDFNKIIDEVKERTAETSRRIFENYETVEVEDFKFDMSFFLLFGDFLKSIKVFTQN